MASKTITARNTSLAGVVAGATFAGGTATVDDSTIGGKRAIEFAKRQGWAVSGGTATAVVLTVDNGKPVADWTVPELKAYLDEAKVQYPSGTNKAGLLAAVQDAFEVKAEGGAAANLSAGHTSGSIPPEGAPPVSNPDKPDNAAVADKWVTPQSGNSETDVAPTISVQPADISVVHPATATFSVTAAGTPTPSKQWQKAEAGAPTVFVDIPGATGASYTTGATSIAVDNGDKYRVVLDNTDGSLTSAVATLTVT